MAEESEYDFAFEFQVKKRKTTKQKIYIVHNCNFKFTPKSKSKINFDKYR